MKKTTPLLAALVCLLFACGGGKSELKADVESTAKLECEKNKLREKMAAGDSTVKEQYEKVREELRDLERKMRDKYRDKMKDDDFRKKAREYNKAAMEACK